MADLCVRGFAFGCNQIKIRILGTVAGGALEPIQLEREHPRRFVFEDSMELRFAVDFGT